MYSICTRNKSTRTYVYSSKLFGPALTLILALASSTVIALPTVNNVYKHAVSSLNPLSTELPFHFSESVYESILYDGDISPFLFKEDDVKIATGYIYNKLNLGAGDFKVFDSFTDSAGVTHVYGAHMVNDIPQHFAKRDLIISEPKATVDFERASATASAQLNIPVYSEFEHALEYVEQPDGNVVYAYKLQLRNNPLTKWVQVWCDATTGEVIQTIDSPRRLRTRLSQFLVVILLRISMYGFTEQAGNFQTDNFGKGGKGGDAVIVNVIHAYENNGANFFTPVDGSRQL
ncbi:hypothetical protein BASA61_004489 [Batrachochytrium salamandrivorans]|nr:hypothetical protein BASA61_004489 [Batrachochytrium salamandrivorans]